MEENITLLPELEIEDFAAVDTRIAVLQTTCYIAVCFIGIPLILGIINYEHFGVDAQKRSILNQLISLFFGTVGICVLFTGFFVCVRCWVGPLGTMAGNFTTIVRRVLLEIVGFLVFEILIYKNLCHIKPLWIMSLNDNFWTTFALAWNVIFAILLCHTNLNIVLDDHPPFFQFISGAEDLIEKSKRQIEPMVFFIVNCTLIVSFMIIRMIKNPVQPPQQNNGQLFNNMIHNPALINNLQLIFVFSLCFLCMVPSIFVTEYGPNGIVLVILPGSVTSALVLPLLFYCFNNNLRKFVWKEVKDWLGINQTQVHHIESLNVISVDMNLHESKT